MTTESTTGPRTGDQQLLDAAVRARVAMSAPRAQRVARLRTESFVGGAFMTAVGVTVAVGWLTGIDGLKTFGLGPAAMKLNVALSIVVLSVCLMLLTGLRGRRSGRRLVLGLSFLVAAVCLLTLLEYATGASLGIDNPLGLDIANAQTRYPGRPSLLATLSLLVLSCGVAACALERVRTAQVAAAVSVAAGATGVVGYLYDIPVLYAPRSTNTLAAHSATTLLIAGLALLAARAGEGYMSLLTGNTAGGIVARRLLPAVLIVPLAAGAVVVWGLDRGLLHTHAAFTLLMTLVAIAGVGLVWHQGVQLRHIDVRRSGAEDAFAVARRALKARDEMAVSLASSEQHLRRTIATSVDGYIAITAEGIVTEWNDAAERMFGWSAQEARGHTLEDLIIPADKASAHRAGLTAHAQTGVGPILGHTVELEGCHRSGRSVPIELSVWAVDDGRSSGFHAFLRDITARKQVDAQLERANEDLSVFAAIAAHDLRAPLTVIKGFAELMLPGTLPGTVVGPEPQGVQDAARRIVAAADRGVALVEDLLAYARVGEGLRAEQLVDLQALAQEAADEQMAVHSRPGAIVVRALPAYVGDQQLLAQLLSNLLGNALKYMPAGRTPEVLVTAATRDQGRHTLSLTVSDNGDPIPEQDHLRIFEAFERGDRAGSPAGSGIGLAICQRVADHHGGNIRLETTPGGNAFVVDLPLTRTQDTLVDAQTSA